MSISRIRDIGNSLGVIIPKLYADSLHLKAGKEISIEMKKGALIIKPRQYSLEELVAQMSSENSIPEISTGKEIGEEVVEYDLDIKDEGYESKRKNPK